MATVIQLSPCSGSTIINVLDTNDIWTTSQLGYFTFTGGTAPGCYNVVGTTGGTATDQILNSQSFTTCSECTGSTLWSIIFCNDEEISYIVDFGPSGTGLTGGNLFYNVTFGTGGDYTPGCYRLATKEPSGEEVEIISYTGPWPNCETCAENPPPSTPTPTPSPTMTPTPTPTSNRPTSPTPTPTNTVTPTITPTVTPTVTPTLTPTITPTVTPTLTPTMTPTPSPLPNVLLRNCITGELVSAPRKNAAIGDIWSATGSTTDCYEVVSYTLTEPTYGLDSSYDDCLECFQDQFTSVIFDTCKDDNNYVTLTATTSSLTFLPSTGSTYYLSFSGADDQYVGCFNYVEFSNAANQYQITNVGNEYTSCYNCSVVNIPTSANTPYYECRICCPCGTGSTANSVSVPHPVYSNQFGQDVTQLNAVQLGGENGLYS